MVQDIIDRSSFGIREFAKYRHTQMLDDKPILLYKEVIDTKKYQSISGLSSVQE